MATTTDHIHSFLTDYEGRGNVERSAEAYRRVLSEFDAFVRSRGRVPETATRADCEAWIDSLRESDFKGSTIHSYAGYVNQFYKWLQAERGVGRNPMREPHRAKPEWIDKNPERRDVSLAEMRAFVAGINHPLDRAVIVALVKTGVRVGELCNLDVADIQTQNGESVLRVAEDISTGESVRGEARTAANARVCETHIPIDGELERVLREWLCMRPDPRSPANPLFVSTGDDWGERLTPPMVRSTVTRYARESGWYQTGAGPAENVTPHYFRHFFTTWMRERVGETGSVQYLRGDQVKENLRAYDHNWQGRAQTAYRENIYSVLGGGHS